MSIFNKDPADNAWRAAASRMAIEATAEEKNETSPELAKPQEANEPKQYATAAEKISDELKKFKGGQKEKVVSKFVAATLTNFSEQDERFAKAVLLTPRTLSDCCAEIMEGVGNSVSDIDVYRAAVKYYFPNSEVHMTMQVEITGDEPTTEELTRVPKVKAPVPAKPKQRAEKPKTEPPQEPKAEVMQLTLF